MGVVDGSKKELMPVIFEDYQKLCMESLSLIREHFSCLSKDGVGVSVPINLPLPQIEIALRKMIFFFEHTEQYEICSEIQEYALVLLGKKIKCYPIEIKYVTKESEA